MADHNKQSGTRTRRGRSVAPTVRQITRELLSRRERHEQAIATLDKLLAALSSNALGRLASTTALRRPRAPVGQPRVRRAPQPVRTAAASLDKIVAVVSEAYGASVAELRAPGRPVRVAKPRLVAMFLAYELSGCSQEQIGNYFGGRKHNAVFHACRAVRKMRRNDPKIDRLLAALRP